MKTVRTVDFRYTVMRNGADFGILRPAGGSWPRILMDDSGEIKTSLSGSFVPPDFDVNWLHDEIRPELILDGVPHTLGRFLPATITPKKTDTSETVQIEAYDRCWLARDYKTETMQYFQAGVNYVSAVSSLLAAAGVGTVSAVATTKTLPEAREDWEIGTSYLSIANELLREINYKDVWFDSDGICRLEPFETISAANIKHVLDDRDVQSMLLPGISRETDIYSAPNVFIVLCSNPDKDAAMVATASNNSPQSPLSITSRGRRIAQVTQVNNIASQEELQAMADRQLTDSLISGETIQVTTGLLPGFGVGEITALQYGDVFAVCRERAWQMNLQPGGTMTHTLERQVLQIGQ